MSDGQSDYEYLRDHNKRVLQQVLDAARFQSKPPLHWNADAKRDWLRHAQNARRRPDGELIYSKHDDAMFRAAILSDIDRLHSGYAVPLYHWLGREAEAA